MQSFTVVFILAQSFTVVFLSLWEHEVVARRSWASVATHLTEDPRARCLARLARAVSSRSIEKLLIK